MYLHGRAFSSHDFWSVLRQDDAFVQYEGKIYRFDSKRLQLLENTLEAPTERIS